MSIVDYKEHLPPGWPFPQKPAVAPSANPTADGNLRLRCHINNQYRVFDKSGELPFGIVFTLVRQRDDDPRRIVLNIAGSVFDVPYALANGYLTTHRRTDLSPLKDQPVGPDRYIILSSPVGREEPFNAAFENIVQPIIVGDPVAACFKADGGYAVRFASTDLHVRLWRYLEGDEIFSPEAESQSRPGEAGKLLCNRPRASHAYIDCVESLRWPPDLTVNLRLTDTASQTPDSSVGVVPPVIEVTTRNPSARSITIQSARRHNFLGPSDYWQRLDSSANDRCTRVVHHDASAIALQNFTITNAITGEAVGNGPLLRHSGHAAGIPGWHVRMTDTTAIRTGETLRRQVDITKLVAGLPDAPYELRLKSKGCWWCEGVISGDHEGKVPKSKRDTVIPPVMLESQDVVRFTMLGGVVVYGEHNAA